MTDVIARARQRTASEALKMRQLMGFAKRGYSYLLSNADSVLSLLVALVFGVLSIIGVGSPTQLASAILVVLVLLSLASLRDRPQRDTIVASVLQIQAALAALDSRDPQTRRAHISQNQDANNEYLMAMLQGAPALTSAKFLAFSGRDARMFVEYILRHSDCPVQMLLKHPDTVGPVQQRWILAELDRMQRYLVPAYPNRLTIRCYRKPYSLRGRKIEPQMVDVGWYTPAVDDDVEVVGHRNPLITAPLDTEEGMALSRMFDEVFESLWRANDTEGGEAAMHS